MIFRQFIAAMLLPLAVSSAALAQNQLAAPVGDVNPLPTLESGGPTAAVTALAFSPDGQTLYSAGYDKVVRVWRRGPATKSYAHDPRATYRVPIGPGRDGVINTLAVSPDGEWLAVSGLGVYRGSSDFAKPGWIVSDDALTPAMRQDRFVIYLFNTRSRAVAILRGHEEDVLNLAFAQRLAGKPQLLVSAGRKAGGATGRVCVWDVDRASALDEKGQLVERGARLHDWIISDVGLVPGEPQPGLAVRVTADNRCKVAIACGDGKLRTREFNADGTALQPMVADEPRNADGRSAEFTYSVAAAADRLLTGGYVRGQGYIQAWDDASDAAPRPASQVQLPPPRGVAAILPRAMSLISSGDGRGLDHVAIVLRSPARQGTGQEYRLALMGVKNLALAGQIDDAAVLGTWTKPPIMVTSPDGRFLAITGDLNREIRVYAAGELFGKLPAVAPLRSDGFDAASVAFATKGAPAELGLLLRGAPTQGPEPRPTDLVLDIDRRTLIPNPVNQGWKVVSPADAGWRANQETNSSGVFTWVGPQGRGTARLKFQPSQVVTAFALVPPRAPLDEPILAVATWDSKIGEPQLGLFRATTGEQIRQLNGHVQPINSLASTVDGRLLASAAEDQTVSVWSMTDIAEIVGRHATLSGITFRPTDGSLVVQRVGAESGPLQADDVIQAIAFDQRESKGKPKPVGSPLEFFEALWNEKPGEFLPLRVRRGSGEQIIKVKLEQGIDERKPLVSLFVSRGRMPEWIAWTPVGPYDVGSRDAERYLGWHFNPSKLGEPVRFARADAYRERLHKQGLLKPLLAHANLTEALRELDRPVAIPRATIFCAVDAAVPVRFGDGAAEQVLVRQPRVTLRMRVQGPSIQKNEVESITWRINDGKPQPLSLDGNNGESLVQEVDLSTRGIYRMQVCLRTREAEPQEVTRDLVLRYQPPPPTIKLENSIEGRQTVHEAQVRFKANVEPGSASQKVAVSLRKGQAAPQMKELAIDESLTLAPGENVLELRAVNENALEGYEEFESDTRTVVLAFEPKDAPQIVLSQIASAGGSAKVELGRPTVVTAGKVRIRGRLTATEPLTVAMIDDKPLHDFRPNAAGEFAIDEDVALKPDSQELRFRAKTANSVEAESRLTVVYRPPLPTLTLTQPDPDRALVEGKDALEIEVKGIPMPPEGLTAADLQPYEVILRVTNDGKPVGQEGNQAAVTIPSGRLTPVDGLIRMVRLLPGDNRIDVVVRSRWQTAPAVERHVFYRRPPRVVGELKVSAPGEKAFADVVAEVDSVSDLTGVECNGREYPVSEVAKRVRDSLWTVTIAQMPLKAGPNVIQMLVSNRDGRALNEGRATVEFAPPKSKLPPRIEVVNRPQGAVKDPNFMTRFVVRSAGSRVQRVELRQDARVIATAADPKQENDGAENFTAAGELGPALLQEGANRLRIVAVNAGGEAVESFTVAHVPEPEWLEIDRPSSPLPQAEFTLTGRVTWSSAIKAEAMERKLQKLRVYVNSGFQQQTPVYHSAGTNRLEFTVKTILNRPKENLIEVVCPDLRPEAGGQQRFTVDCAQPREEPRTLHLLIVAITPARAQSSDKDLALRALKSLQARGAGAQGLRSTVFQHVMMHPYVKDQPTQVVSGYVTCEHIRDALESIRRHSKPNDVALIYWLGSEAVDDNGDLFLLTSESRPGRKLARSAIALNEILNFPRETPGACALLLDTAGTGMKPDVPPALPLPSTRVAVLRYAWSGKGVPVPGLLLALEESSQKRTATALQDLAAIAARSRQEYKDLPAWVDNLKDLPALAELVISRKP